MKGNSEYRPACGGVGFPGINQEVAWVKATFYVEGGSTTVRVTADGKIVAEKDVVGGQTVTLEGRISPRYVSEIIVGLYPVAAAISNVTIEWADAAQAPGGQEFPKVLLYGGIAVLVGIVGWVIVKGRK